jgi:DNA-binding transcriptional LysR family regulator
LERQLPTVSIRADVGKPDRLLRLMLDGVLDIAIMYSPQLRPGLEVQVLLEDNLILVSTDPDYTTELDEDYIFMDYGDEFVHAHSLHFPNFQTSQVTLALGTLGARYIIEHKRAAYLPARFVQDFIDDHELHVVKGAPVFPFPAYVVWNPEKEGGALEKSLQLLKRVAERIDEDQNELFEDEGIGEELSFVLGIGIEGTGSSGDN